MKERGFGNIVFNMISGHQQNKKKSREIKNVLPNSGKKGTKSCSQQYAATESASKAFAVNWNEFMPSPL